MKLLLVEDNRETAEHIVRALTGAGHDVDHDTDGFAGMHRARSDEYAAVILDRMLPGVDGLSITKWIRGQGIKTPILLLTTMSGIDDRVEGLEGGADDYLVKPFAFAELLARVNALARRGDKDGRSVPTKLSALDLEMDLIARTVRRSGQSIELQAQEFRLLEYMLRNAGRTVTRAMLLENVWKLNFDPRTNVVETHMSRLRSKLNRPGTSELIHTIRGTGYVLRAP